MAYTITENCGKGVLESFKLFIEKYTELPNKEWGQIKKCLESRIIEKEEILLHEGKVCKHLYFVESGLLRYYVNKDGNEITKFFTVAPYCFTSQVSFTSEKPSKENIQALEKSVLLQIELKHANDLLELKSWNNFIRKLIQEVQFYTEELLEEMQTVTAEARYEKMIKNQPELLQRIPLKYVASYFGVAPQSLSRIRKNLITKRRS